MLAVVLKGERLSDALALVIARADADGVDVAPVLLALRVLLGVPVDLRGGRQQQTGAQALGEAQHVEGAQHVGLDRLDPVGLVEHGGGGTRQMVDLIHLHAERRGHL